MKRLFKTFFVLFIILSFSIVKAENDAPTIDNFELLVNDSIVEPIEGYYYIDRYEYKISFNVSEVNDNYCILYLSDDNNYDVDCNYELQNINNRSSGIEESIKISFIKKMDYDKLTEEQENGNYSRSINDLEKFNIFEFKYKNDVRKEYDELFFTFEYVKDSKGNILNKTNGKYILEEEENYSFYFKPNKYIEGAIYSWLYTIYNKNQSDSVSKGDDDELVNGMVKVDIMFASSDEFYEIPSDKINIYVSGKSETEISGGSSYDFDIEVPNHKYTHFDVEMNYNNNELVEEIYDEVWILNYNYFNNNNPLKLHLKPYYYMDGVSVDIELIDYISNGEDDEKHIIFNKKLTLNNNQDNIVEIPYFENNFDNGKIYDLQIVINNNEEQKIEGQILFSRGFGYLNAYTKDSKLFVGFNAGGGYPNNFASEYELAETMGDIIYIAFKAERLNDNEEYNFKVIDEINNEYYNENIKGNILNSNYLYIPVSIPKKNKDISYYVKIYNSLNEEIISGALFLTTSFYDGWSVSGTLLGDNVIHTYSNDVLIKENSNNLKLYIKGNNYISDKQYKYFIRFGYNYITGNIMGNEINEGKTISFDYNQKLFDDSDYSRTFCYGIEGDKSSATNIYFKFISEEEFNNVKRNGILTFDDIKIDKMNKRAGDNKLLLVDSNGDDVLKEQSYTVNYYKDNELSDIETIKETTYYFQEGMEIDTNKVNLKNKYPGYKFKTTSKTDFDEETQEYFLHPIKDGDTLEVYYEKDEVEYSVEYYYDGVKDNSLTLTKEALFESSVEEYEDKLKYGYKLDKTENLPLTISDNKSENVIKVYYVPDEKQIKKVSYKIEYYKNNKLSDTEEIVGSIQVLKNKIKVDKSKINKEKYVGYKYIENSIVEEIEDDGIIKVNYESENYPYIIEYYYNGVKDDISTISKEALFESSVEEYEDKIKAGYKLDKKENLPLTISNNKDKNIIKIYYVVDENNTEKVEIRDFKVIKGKDNSIELSYSGNDFVVGYEIYRSESKTGKYKKIKTITNEKYIDSGLTYGKRYYYKVKAYNKVNSETTKIISLKLIPDKVNLSINSASTNNVKLNWNKINVTGYEVYMGSKKITTITKNGTLTYNKTKLKANTTYKFKVRAFKTVKGKKIYGPWSNVVSAKTAPSKPSLSLSLKSLTEMNIKIGSAKGSSLYQVEKSLDGKTYTALDNLNSAGILVASELEIGKTYFFRVRACSAQNSCSGWVTKSLKQTTLAPKLSLATESKKVTVIVTAVNGADGYEVYRSTSKKKGYKLQGDTSNLLLENATKKGKTYYYKVRSYKLVDGKKVYSPYSGIKKIKSK